MWWAQAYLRTEWHLDASSSLATIDMGLKVGAVVPLFLGGAGSPHNSVAWAESYLRIKWHLDPASRLATIDMGRKVGAVPLFLGGGVELGPQPGCYFAVLSLFGLKAQHMKWTANLQTRIREHCLSCVLERFDCHVRHSQLCPPRSCGTVVAVQSPRCVALIRVWGIHSLWPIRWNIPCNCKSVRHITQSILRKR